MTDSTSFQWIFLEELKEYCLHHLFSPSTEFVRRNVTDTVHAVVEYLSNICPTECPQYGSCNKGKCICNEGTVSQLINSKQEIDQLYSIFFKRSVFSIKCAGQSKGS